MSHSYSRDKLEESRRRKRAQQAAQQQRVNLPSTNSWRGVTPSQVAKPAQQTAPKTTVSRPAVQSSAGWKGVTPSQVAKPAARQTAPKAPQTAAVKQLPTFSVGQSLAQRTQQNIRNDNTRRARAARAREGQRQAAQANAAALKKDRAALAANSLKWHQTSDAAVRRRLEAENSAIRARRGYAYDSRTGSTFDSKGNELSLAARQIYGGRAETAKQFRDVAQTKDFVRDTSRTASQPSILDVARSVTADNPHYAIQSGQKAHSIIASLLNRSGETWTDADTKARDEARDALQKEMQAIYQQYGATYQPRLSADETVKDLALRGADEQTLEYVRENLRLRDASDRLGQGLTAVGKRLEASIPSLVDTVKQAISNQSENKENEAFTRLEEQEKQLELQLQNMQSQDENGKVPADYQQVYDELQRVREEKNSLKVTKSVDQNRWSQRMLREANEAQANAEAGLAPAPRWVAEQAISLASNAPTMAASAVPVVGPALGSLVMGAQAAGQRAFELNEQGKSAGEALGRGTVSGIIEAATEKLPLERMAEILHSGGTNAVKNILRQMGTESTEEVASYFLNYVSDLAAADPDAKFSLAELAQSAAGGAFGGLVFGTAGTVGAKLAQRNEGGIYDDTAYERDVVRSLQDADAQLRAARSMPEGAAREAAVSAAREKMSQTIADYTTRYLAAHEEMNARDGLFGNPDGTANGFAGKKIPTYDELIEKPDVRVVDIRETPAGSYREQRRNFMNSEEGQQLYRQPVTNYDTGEMVFVTPKTLEHSFSNGGQLQISAAKQVQQIIAHSVLTSAEPITHGDSNATGIYTLFGAVRTNDGVQPVKLKVKEYQLGNQQIPQNIAEYFNTYGVPEQYASAYDNKVLALESIEKEEASSSVQPTLAAKQTAQGEYPSASSLKDASSSAATMPFGVNDPSTSSYITVADLMGLVNGDARRYLPKENKSINQLLDNRLQLPELVADDTLVANSIRQNAGNSNTSDTNIPLSEAMQYGKTPEQAMMEAKAKAEGERVRQVRAAAERATTSVDSDPETHTPKRVGRATTIQKPYNGKVPVQTEAAETAAPVVISENAVEDARQAITASQQSGTFSKMIKTILQSVFQRGGGRRSIRIQGLEFDGKPYDVTLGGKFAAKVASDPNMSKEKLAVFSEIDQAVATARYAGSGEYNKQKTKAESVQRYDYFEKSLMINGQPFVMTFDVEVYKDTNNFRTYRVIKEMSLTPSTAAVGPQPTAPDGAGSLDSTPTAASPQSFSGSHTAMQSGPSDNSIRRNAENSNTSYADIPAWDWTPEMARAAKKRMSEVWQALTDLDAHGKQQSDEFRELWDEKEQLKEQLTVRGVKNGPVTPDVDQADRTRAASGTAAGYAPVSDEMRRAGGKAKRTAADYLDLMDAVARRNAKSEQANRETYRELRSAWDEVRPLDRKIESVRRQAQLSDNDMRLLQAASASGHSEILADCENQPAALHLYELEKQRRETLAPVREYNSRVRLEREMQAAEWAETIASYASDKARGLYYLTETPERNIYDIFGKQHRAEADEFIREYLKPVHESVAESTRLQNRLRERISGLNLNRHESAIVQMLGEGEKAAALQYAEEHGIRLDGETEARLNHAANVFREIYDELFDMINDAEVRNGLEPTQKRGNYFPHFTEKAPDTLLARAMWRIGMKLTGRDTLTTDLAGLTEKFRPGHQWERHLQHREGKNTVYDAVTGFDQYVSEISDYIMLTDQIQKLRALEDSVRYTLSDEGTQRKIDEIKSDFMKDPLKRRQEIEAVYDDGGDRTAFQRAIDPLLRQKEAGMRNFVTELRRYTDSLCGKKHRGDRGIEDIVGRDVYEISKNVESRVAANMIALNPGSWLTNFIPLTQAAGEIDTKSLLQGMAETVRAAFSDDGFVNTSTFLTSRYGSDSISKTALRRVSDLAGAPMECIDHFTAESIVRARVAQNIGRHMALDEAFAEADSFASALMADRSKGATPGAFEMKNPLVKVFTMYQLETNNQLRYFFKDLPRHMEGKSRAAAIASTGLALTKAFTLAFFYNRIYHELTGRDSALDPIGLIVEAFGLDPFDDDEDKDKKKSGVDTAFTLGKGIAEQLPFVGGLIGGGRVPISAAFPDVGKVADEITQGYDPKRIAFTAAKEAAKPAAYLLLPFGGGALKRAIEGAATVSAGGSYGVNKNGEKILQFPVYGQTPRDWAQAMLFGKSSLKTAQDWAENGYDTLNADETKAFDQMRKQMKWHRDENGKPVDNSEAVFAAIKALRTISESNENRDVSAGQARAMLFNDNDLSTAQKEFLDKNLISGGQSGFYTSETAFKVSQMVRESRQSDAIEAAKHGISVELFAEWDEILQQANSDNLVDAADYTEGGNNKLYATNTLLANILNEYASNPDVSESEVNAFADYFIVSAMSKADREKWNDSVKGVVNASDYVKFKGDLAEYQKEFKGTGADNASNIASILDSYTNLSDEQKGVLMSTYTDSNKSNPFTVSDMEKRLKDNAFYKDLNDDGHTTLREYCNEYTQAIADGKNLTGWKAKAYMANEAGIKPEIYALFQVALKANDYDENGSYKSAEIEAAVKCIPGLTDKQRGYLWQAAKGGKTSKNNPWGATDVSKYSSSKSDAVNPVEGGAISSGFGWRQSFQTSGGQSSNNHKAIDIAAPAGTAVKAAMGGKITLVYKGDYGGYGNTVEIDHGNGIITKYHHMLDGSLEGLSVGQEVKAGQQIGKVGSTGNSTGPHLDFQVQKDGDFVDPRNYIPGYGAGSNLVYSGSASAGTIASGKSAASSSKKSSGSRKSGGSSGLRKPSALKGLPVFR